MPQFKMELVMEFADGVKEEQQPQLAVERLRCSPAYRCTHRVLVALCCLDL